MASKQRFSADEKLRIVEEARQPGASVSETCRRHGIAASVFYRWEAQMREGARRALAEGNGGRKTAREKAEAERLREQLAKKNNVIAVSVLPDASVRSATVPVGSPVPAPWWFRRSGDCSWTSRRHGWRSWSTGAG
jgi:transposase-like protein